MIVTVHTPNGLKNPEFAVAIRGAVDGLASEQQLEVMPPEGSGEMVCGTVLAMWSGPAAHVPASLVENHHDPACRSFSSLMMVLAITGQKDVLPGEQITLVMLRRSSIQVARTVPGPLGARRSS